MGGQLRKHWQDLQILMVSDIQEVVSHQGDSWNLQLVTQMVMQWMQAGPSGAHLELELQEVSDVKNSQTSC